jgi:hypothetical protein
MTSFVSSFFATFERSISESDVSTVATLYADVFTFGGPRGVQTVKKDDFLKLLPKRKEYFASMGLGKSTVASIDEIPLDAKYILARVVWQMTLKISSEVSKQFETRATYILEIKNDTPVIVMQLDHQDLGEKVNALRAT